MRIVVEYSMVLMLIEQEVVDVGYECSSCLPSEYLSVMQARKSR